MSTAQLTGKSKSHLTQEEVAQLEEQEFETGPMAVLVAAVQQGSQVLIHGRNDHKYLARVKAFDRHCNMVLENVKEMWVERKKGKKQGVNRDRYVSKMFLRGDTVILIVRSAV